MGDSDALYKWVLSLLEPSAGKSLLDIGCGEGSLVRLSAQQGLDSFGIDLSPIGVKTARIHVGQAVISLGNGEHLPFSDQSFDFLTNIGSLEHFPNPGEGLSEMLRVLKLDGKAAILLPNSYYLPDIVWHVWRTGYGPSHKQLLERFATHREWFDFIEAHGFKVVKSHKYNFRLPRSKNDFGWYLRNPRKILYLTISPFIPFNLSNHFLYLCARA
jgi:ubiquinone/menaquinone biosynthesis C-methylase UbiE